MEHHSFARLLPPAWSELPGLDRFHFVGEVASTVGAIGAESDEIVQALLALSPAHAASVVEVLVLAAHSLLHRRCAGNPALSADEFATELALVIGDVIHGGIPTTQRRLLNVLVDRAWGQYRKPFRRRRLAVGQSEIVERLPDCGRHPEDVLDRVALLEFRRVLASGLPTQRALVRCWNSAIELSGHEHRSQAEQDRLKYVRTRLRHAAPPDLVR